MTAAKKPSKAWKQFERRVAAYWGCLRNVLSGSANRPDRDPSDTTHERLHIECKLHQRQEVWRLWDHAKKQSKGRKPVILCLGSPHRPGWIIAFHSDDAATFIKEWLNSRKVTVLFDQGPGRYDVIELDGEADDSGDV